MSKQNIVSLEGRSCAVSPEIRAAPRPARPTICARVVAAPAHAGADLAHDAQLLPIGGRVEDVVEVKHDAARYLTEARTVERHHGASHAQRCPEARQVLEPRDDPPQAERLSIGQSVEGEIDDQVLVQRDGIAAVPVAGSKRQQADVDHLGQAVPTSLRRAGRVETGGQAIGTAWAALNSRAASARRHRNTAVCRRRGQPAAGRQAATSRDATGQAQPGQASPLLAADPEWQCGALLPIRRSGHALQVA